MKFDELEVIAHASPRRLQVIGMATLIGQPLFFFIWKYWIPQPYENGLLRIAIAALGFVLLIPKIANNPAGILTRQFFLCLSFIQLPCFFSWMYICNHGNDVWLPSLCIAVLLYFNLTDWRIAIIGTIGGMLISLAFYLTLFYELPSFEVDALSKGIVIFSFSFICILILGYSSANLRREHLQYVLSTMGIMAHELRTPLASSVLIADTLENYAENIEEGEDQSLLKKLARRLRMLAAGMNHQIDTYIANAGILNPLHSNEMISAFDMVNACRDNYPYKTTVESGCVVLNLDKDFQFLSSRIDFSKVLDNLLKNALYSLAKSGRNLSPGDITFDVCVVNNEGLIAITDAGIGVKKEILIDIFEPFFSTNKGAGHGLGLTYCKRVVKSARGRISAESTPGMGAKFTIYLPIQS